METKKQKDILTLAKNNRKTPTKAESVLWQIIRNKSTKHKFRRQHPAGKYIVDFICLKKLLIIECDGGQHTIESDKERTAYLNLNGYKVLRFWNNEILKNPQGVWAVIEEELSK